MDKIVEMNVKNSIEMWDGENTINFFERGYLNLKKFNFKNYIKLCSKEV